MTAVSNHLWKQVLQQGKKTDARIPVTHAKVKSQCKLPVSRYLNIERLRPGFDRGPKNQ